MQLAETEVPAGDVSAQPNTEMNGRDHMIDNIYAAHQGRYPASWDRLLPIVSLAMAALYIPAAVWGQTNTFPASGNVGIGTATPGSQLSVYGSAGTGAPVAGAGALLLGDSELYTYGAGGALLFGGGNTTTAYFAGIKGFLTDGGDNAQGNLNFYTRVNATDANLTQQMTVLPNGNVGIGTTNPVHLLQVAGTIGAEEVIVSSTGADYVFQPDYRLRPMSEVAAFIEQNHHLPDIPSAAEVKEKGLSLGEMQTKLLAKIEELTLHMIEADEHSRHLEQQNRELQDRIARLEAAGDGSGNRQR
jgi:hypothetical protein